MPFKSQSQARYMYQNHPDIAKRWQDEAPVDITNLPEKKGKQTKFKKPSGKFDGRRKSMKRLGLKKSHFE